MTTLMQNFIHYSGRLVSKRTSLKKMQSGVGTCDTTELSRELDVWTQTNFLLQLFFFLRYICQWGFHCSLGGLWLKRSVSSHPLRKDWLMSWNSVVSPVHFLFFWQKIFLWSLNLCNPSLRRYRLFFTWRSLMLILCLHPNWSATRVLTHSCSGGDSRR